MFTINDRNVGASEVAKPMAAGIGLQQSTFGAISKGTKFRRGNGAPLMRKYNSGTAEILEGPDKGKFQKISDDKPVFLNAKPMAASADEDGAPAAGRSLPITDKILAATAKSGAEVWIKYSGPSGSGSITGVIKQTPEGWVVKDPYTKKAVTLQTTDIKGLRPTGQRGAKMSSAPMAAGMGPLSSKAASAVKAVLGNDPPGVKRALDILKSGGLSQLLQHLKENYGDSVKAEVQAKVSAGKTAMSASSVKPGTLSSLATRGARVFIDWGNGNDWGTIDDVAFDGKSIEFDGDDGRRTIPVNKIHELTLEGGRSLVAGTKPMVAAQGNDPGARYEQQAKAYEEAAIAAMKRRDYKNAEENVNAARFSRETAILARKQAGYKAAATNADPATKSASAKYIFPSEKQAQAFVETLLRANLGFKTAYRGRAAVVLNPQLREAMVSDTARKLGGKPPAAASQVQANSQLS